MKTISIKVGLTVLIIAVLLSVIGGIVGAASPSDGLPNMVSSIKDKVDSIYSELTSGTHGLAAIKTAIDGLPVTAWFTSIFSSISGNLSVIIGKLNWMEGYIVNIHDEGEMVLDRIEPSWGYSGNFTVYPGCTTDAYVSASPFESVGPKHVVMTVDVSDFTPDPPNQVGQGLLVEATIGDNTEPVTVFACTDWYNYPESEFVTLDFVANNWTILAANCAVAPFKIYYSVISTAAAFP